MLALGKQVAIEIVTRVTRQKTWIRPDIFAVVKFDYSSSCLFVCRLPRRTTPAGENDRTKTVLGATKPRTRERVRNGGRERLPH